MKAIELKCSVVSCTINAPNSSAMTPEISIGLISFDRLSRFQRMRGPIPSRKANGTISHANKVLKNGAPIDTEPKPNCLCTSGNSVPISTTTSAAINNTLLANRAFSRDTSSKLPRTRTDEPFSANSNSEPPMTNTRKPRMNMPRAGSDANACTETRIPERTRKVPNRLSENAEIASSTVHALKVPRFSVTASECISAVPASQGMNDAFSTGSQNHQPPQPSS